jgi:hypothetical protein
MSNPEYNEMKALNYSGAKVLITRSPLHYKTWLNRTEEEETPALRIGRLVHLASLQPDVFDATIKVAPKCDKRTKEGKEIWATFQSMLQTGQEAISEQEGELVTNVSIAARDGIDFVRSAVGATGKPVVETAYSALYNGANIKGRPDMVIPTADGNVVVDVKTCGDAGKPFAKDCANFMYHLQAAFYTTLVPNCSGFYFVAVEKEVPHAFAIYKLDEASLAEGQRLMDSAVELYKQCNLFRTYPGYPTTPQTLSIPRWAIGQVE